MKFTVSSIVALIALGAQAAPKPAQYGSPIPDYAGANGGGSVAPNQDYNIPQPLPAIVDPIQDYGSKVPQVGVIFGANGGGHQSVDYPPTAPVDPYVPAQGDEYGNGDYGGRSGRKSGHRGGKKSGGVSLRERLAAKRGQHGGRSGSSGGYY